MGIYRVDVQSGRFSPVLRVDPPPRLFAHEVSPVGNTLIYGRQERPKGPHQILSRDLTTGEEKLLYAGDPDPRPLSISLSPDGRWLAFMNMSKERVLRVMPASGGETRDLLRFEETRVFFPAIEWTADGKYILFPRLHPTKDQQEFALWRIAAEGGEPEELNLVMANFENLSVHPDGKHLALSSPGLTMKSPSVWVMENFLPTARSSPASK
jgi:Tol biopolymer transport system component